MEKNNSKLKTKVLNRAVSITALLLVAGLLFTGCPQKVKEEPKPVYYTVTLVHVGGTLTADPAIQDGKALKDSEITFTASPADPSTHEVDKWEVTGGQIVSGGGEGSANVKVKITANTTVRVTFKKKTHPLILKSLTIFGKNAVSGRIIVDYSKTEVRASDVSASFDYGSVTGETIPVIVTNGTLGVEENTVSLSIAAVEGKYEAWTKDIVVSRQDAAPIDKTYTVGSVAFTMKGIAAVNDAPLGDNDYDNNKPHTVSLSAYLIEETEVTQELWQEVMGNNPSWFNGSYGKEPAVGETQGKRPVENVNWYQAIAFCNKLSIKLNLEPCYTVNVGGNPVDFAALSFDQIPTTGNADWNKAELDMNKNGFRLPTEVEWEWAAKGGTDDKWSGTNTEAELKNYAWYGSNSGYKTHEVKKKDPNGYGLYDMSGNVWEWLWDWYGTIPASLGADYAGPASGSYRVGRGGSWGSWGSSDYCRVGYRVNNSPVSRGGNLGMRLACRP